MKSSAELKLSGLNPFRVVGRTRGAQWFANLLPLFLMSIVSCDRLSDKEAEIQMQRELVAEWLEEFEENTVVHVFDKTNLSELGGPAEPVLAPEVVRKAGLVMVGDHLVFTEIQEAATPSNTFRYWQAAFDSPDSPTKLIDGVGRNVSFDSLRMAGLHAEQFFFVDRERGGFLLTSKGSGSIEGRVWLEDAEHLCLLFRSTHNSIRECAQYVRCLLDDHGQVFLPVLEELRWQAGRGR